MQKSRALEIVATLLLLGGALTYQLMREAAVDKNLVPEEVPTVPEQTVKLVEEDEVKLDLPVEKTLSEKVEEYLRGLRSTKVEPYNPHLSTLGTAPNWSELDKYQKTITRSEFELMLSQVYSVGDAWKQWIEVQDEFALIVKSAADPDAERYRLEFGDGSAAPVVTSWRPAKRLTPAPVGKALEGLVVALDPGHIGGDAWAGIEERQFSVEGDPPVREGEITLQVAEMLKKRLELLGAKVVLVRSKLEPLNPKRPEHYTHQAYEELKGKGIVPSAPAVDALRNKMFYRVDEIRTRAHLVNTVIKPDIVVCLHFNAESWGDPEAPELVEKSHFHVLLHGAFTASELAKDDERFSMVKKILLKCHSEEAGLSEVVAEEAQKLNKLPAYQYQPDSKRALMVNENPYLWARNLLANKLYECPVVYMEPYVMNSKVDYARLQMGDYDGLVNLDGVEYPSIFREYVDGLVNGLQRYYKEQRGELPPAVIEEK